MSNKTKPGKYQLPNGRAIYHLNPYETDFVFNEIFSEEVYFQHGIKIKDDDTIFDIGANIGLFSLYIKERFPNCKIYAFEPSPEVYQLLKLNMTPFGKSVRCYPYGISDNNDTSPFHYYSGYSVISGFHTNQDRDANIIISGMKAYQEINSNNSDEPSTDSEIENLVRGRLEKQKTYPCQMSTLSNIIQKNNVSRIDFLKIDAEGSELAALRGIEEQDWNKIRQIAMEVHSKKDLDQIIPLLENQQFQIHIEEDKLLKTSGIYNLFAISKTNKR